MKNRLIFDVGMHIGQDTDYYLSKGYHVVGIEADPFLCEQAKEKYKSYLETKQLQLVNCAVFTEDDKEVAFHIGENSLMSSLTPKYVTKLGTVISSVISVKTQTLASLMKTYGVPYYCKIDIEGYDRFAVESLLELPLYISVESECVAEGEILPDEEILASLNALSKAGYQKFKLVDQYSSNVLGYNKKFYTPLRQTLLHLSETDPSSNWREKTTRISFPIWGYRPNGK